MKNKILLTIISICGISLTGCTASISTETNSPTNTTPANTATKHTANSNTTTKSDSSKPTLKNEKKPEGKAKTAKKDVPVPSDWVYVYDENKGYGFSVPELKNHILCPQFRKEQQANLKQLIISMYLPLQLLQKLIFSFLPLRIKR